MAPWKYARPDSAATASRTHAPGRIPAAFTRLSCCCQTRDLARGAGLTRHPVSRLRAEWRSEVCAGAEHPVAKRRQRRMVGDGWLYTIPRMMGMRFLVAGSSVSGQIAAVGVSKPTCDNRRVLVTTGHETADNHKCGSRSEMPKQAKMLAADGGSLSPGELPSAIGLRAGLRDNTRGLSPTSFRRKAGWKPVRGSRGRVKGSQGESRESRGQTTTPISY